MLFSNIVCVALLVLLVGDFTSVDAFHFSRLRYPEDSDTLELYEPDEDLEAEFKEFQRSLHRKRLNKRQLRNLAG
nr:expressed protein [Hymenolepis microstoma]